MSWREDPCPASLGGASYACLFLRVDRYVEIASIALPNTAYGSALRAPWRLALAASAGIAFGCAIFVTAQCPRPRAAL